MMNSTSYQKIALSPPLFIKVFPFHIVFDKNMKIIQLGDLLKKISLIKTGLTITDFFIIKNPPIPFEFSVLLKNKNTVFLLESIKKKFHLKGEMVFDKTTDCMIFLCNLSIKTPAELKKYGLSLDDFPLNDAMYDFVFSYESLSSHDSTLRKQTEKKFTEIIESFPDGILIINQTGQIISVDRQIEKLFGYSKKELLGSKVERLIPERYRTKHINYRNHYFKHPCTKKMGTRQDLYGLHKDHHEFPVDILLNTLNTPEGILAIGIIRDITKEKNLLAKTEKLARYDMLTTLPNRLYFNEMIGHQFALTQRQQRKFALMLIDLDNFKSINDYYGHHIGDKVLQEASLRFKQTIRKGDFLARLGGDEFIILVEDMTNLDTPGIIAQKLITAFEPSMSISEHQIKVTVCIGIAIYPIAGHSENELTKNADIALYRAKNKGANQFTYFTEELGEIYTKRLQIQQEISLAIENKELYLVYQPQVDLRTKKVIGIEVLLRWTSPKFGPLSPEVFIPMAERSRLMPGIDKWVFETTCKQLNRWKKMGIKDLKVSINVSVTLLKSTNLPQQLYNLCNKYDIPVNTIELEITETAIMDPAFKSFEILDKLHELGFQLSIDDFGAGYSSLSRLNKMPIQTLKIDKSFITDIKTKNLLIIKSIIELAKNLNLNVIAEGVETERAYNCLLKIHCAQAQGYYFYKPLSVDNITKLLKDIKT